jgi:hypothetical protein
MDDTLIPVDIIREIFTYIPLANSPYKRLCKQANTEVHPRVRHYCSLEGGDWKVDHIMRNMSSLKKEIVMTDIHGNKYKSHKFRMEPL